MSGETTLPDPTVARDARAEAAAAVGVRASDGVVPLVLEPSPPAVHDDDWFADDPTDPAGVDPGSSVVSPVGSAGWEELVGARPELEPFARDRWLAAHRRLEAVPESYVSTRQALHRLALYVMSPARIGVNGKMALRFTVDGFGTPFFGDDEQVRLQGTLLVRQRGGDVVTSPLGSLREAAELFGVEIDPELAAGMHDVPEVGEPGELLAVDAASARALADWYGFAFSTLERLRAEAREDEGASRVQLWPEHFDPAFEAGSDADGRRAGFGASPGDSSSPTPYLYISLWYRDRVPDDPFWNAPFGAMLGYDEILGAGNQQARALDFLRAGRDLLRR